MRPAFCCRLPHVALGSDTHAVARRRAVRKSRARSVLVLGELLLRARVRRDRAQPQPLPDVREQARQPHLRQLALDLLRLPDIRLDPDAQPEPSQVRQSRGRRDHHLALHEQAQRARSRSTYFFVSGYYQSDPIKAFIRKARQSNPKLYRRSCSSTWCGSARTWCSSRSRSRSTA